MQSFPVVIADIWENGDGVAKKHSANAQLLAKISIKFPPVLPGFAGLIQSRLFNGD
jgi:hypothetical protein